MATQASKIKGKDLMIFVTEGSSTYALALCTNTTLSITAETNDYKTKDDSSYAKPEVDTISWKATSDNYYCVGDTTTAGATAEKIAKLMLAKTIVSIAVAETADAGTDAELPTDGWEEDTSGTSFIFSGKAIIDSFELTASNGDYASCSISLTGYGKLDTIG